MDPAEQPATPGKEDECKECRTGGYVYDFRCPSCVARWALRLPTRDMRRAAWKAHPEAHDAIRALMSKPSGSP